MLPLTRSRPAVPYVAYFNVVNCWFLTNCYHAIAVQHWVENSSFEWQQDQENISRLFWTKPQVCRPLTHTYILSVLFLSRAINSTVHHRSDFCVQVYCYIDYIIIRYTDTWRGWVSCWALQLCLEHAISWLGGVHVPWSCLSSTLALVVPLTWLSAISDRAYRVAAVRTWNSLPPEVTTSSSCLLSFKTKLKTRLFSASFPHMTVNWLKTFFTLNCTVM